MARACLPPALRSGVWVTDLPAPWLPVWQVEWVSALEAAVAKIVKLVAGVDEEPAAAASRPSGSRGGGGGGGGGSSAWADQLERSFASSRSGGGGGGDGSSSGPRGRRDGLLPGGGGGGDSGGGGGSGQPQMVKVVSYGAAEAGGPARNGSAAYGGGYGSGGGGGGLGQQPSATYGGAYGSGGGGLGQQPSATYGGAYGSGGGGLGQQPSASTSDYGLVSVDYGAIAGGTLLCLSCCCPQLAELGACSNSLLATLSFPSFFPSLSWLCFRWAHQAWVHPSTPRGGGGGGGACNCATLRQLVLDRVEDGSCRGALRP